MLIDIEIGTGFSIHILDLNRLEMPQLFYGINFELVIFLNSYTLPSQIFLCEKWADKMSFGLFM